MSNNNKICYNTKIQTFSRTKHSLSSPRRAPCKKLSATPFASSSLHPANSIFLSHKINTSQSTVFFSHKKSTPATSTNQPNTLSMWIVGIATCCSLFALLESQPAKDPAKTNREKICVRVGDRCVLSYPAGREHRIGPGRPEDRLGHMAHHG